MHRVGLAAIGLSAAGCSLVLDFSPAALPVDAAIDAPYSQAECDYLEPNDTAAEAPLITPAETGPAAICAGEQRDFYRFVVPPMTASVTVRISLMSRLGGDLDLRITDATGSTTYGQSRGTSNEESVTCPGQSPPCPQLPEGEAAFEVVAGNVGDVNRYDFSLTINPE